MIPVKNLLVTIIIMCMICGCFEPSNQKEGVIPDNNTHEHVNAPHQSGQFIFNDTLGNVDRPITIYTYRPAAWNTSGPILIVMHGAGRNGQSERDVWIPFGEKYSSFIVAPEFSGTYYPGDNMYAGGNMYPQNWADTKGKPNPRSNWTYMAIEHLFDEIKNTTGAKQNTYLLFGHSAGAQFVHRLVTFLPEARYSRAVAANAGVYLLPVYSVPYGFGLHNSPLSEQYLPRIFSRKLIIMSGEADISTNDSNLASFPEAESQGRSRFERALFYYNTAQSEAERLHISFNWEYHTVPGIGHDETGMAGPSAALLFG